MLNEGHRPGDAKRACRRRGSNTDRDRSVLGAGRRPLVGKGLPVSGQRHRPVGIHRTESHFVAVAIPFRWITVLYAAVRPAAVPAIHHPRRIGENQLGVAPRKITVGGPHQRRYPRDKGRRRACAIKVQVVCALTERCGESLVIRAAAFRGGAYPEIGTRARILGIVAPAVNPAHRQETSISQVTVMGGIAPDPTVVPGRLDLQCSPSAVAGSSGQFQRRDEPGGKNLPRRQQPRGPTVVTDRNFGGVERDRLDQSGLVSPLAMRAENLIRRKGRPRRHTHDAHPIVSRRDEPGRLRAMA